eukprot:CAMPEP_0113537440 /NCGR_PEP_ID=MMETSP0015_2-20120614/6827_1 /TAXON_ID=2838 /ORGANISM="Odontella" /LENGTH=398 /DNA_ID=CAMNT_0000436935 /DNA_START=67 /DNA_END=1263 /DNA_ORIENTATION=+ /assembly_acc=CAM_ASM_000160
MTVCGNGINEVLTELEAGKYLVIVSGNDTAEDPNRTNPEYMLTRFDCFSNGTVPSGVGSSFSPSEFVLSSQPTVLGAPSVLPTLSLHPSYGSGPTVSPMLSLEPSESLSLMPSFFPSASFSPSLSVPPSSGDVPGENRMVSLNSVDSLRTCDGTNTSWMENDFHRAEITFVYAVESNVDTNSFFPHLEKFILDSVAKSTLTCQGSGGSSTLRVRNLEDSGHHVAIVQYPPNEVVSQTSPCTPTQIEAKACLVVRSKVLIAYEASTLLSQATFDVLHHLEQYIDHETLLSPIPHIVSIHYLGPEPISPVHVLSMSVGKSIGDDMSHGLVFLALFGSVALSTASLILLCGRTKPGTHHLSYVTSKAAEEIEEMSDASLDNMKQDLWDVSTMRSEEHLGPF